jgi:hypothetical protein
LKAEAAGGRPCDDVLAPAKPSRSEEKWSPTMKKTLITGLASAMALSTAAPAAAQYGSPYRPTEQYQQDLQTYQNQQDRYRNQQADYASARARSYSSRRRS